MKKIIYLVNVLLAAFTIKAQTPPAWVQYTGPHNYQNNDVREVSTGVDTLGNVYTGASYYDTIANTEKILVVKYNLTGAQQWIKYYNSTANFADSYLVKLLVDKSGNTYACGYGHHGGSSSKDFMVVKFDNAGNQQWVNYWDGGQNVWDYITSATFDASGNIVVAGYCNNNTGTNGDDLGVVKYSSSGSQIWSYVYNNSSSNDEDRAESVTTDPSGNVYVTGSTYTSGARNMLVIKLNNSGVNQWTKIISHSNPGNDEKGYSIVADAAGNSYVTGSLSDWTTMKLDPSGATLWTNHHGTNSSLNTTTLKKVMLDKNNNVIVAGDEYIGGGNSSDLSVFKLNNSTGVSLWSLTYNNSGSDAFGDAKLDTSGNVYTCGKFDGPSGKDISSMIVSAGGTVIWHTSYTNPARNSGADQAFEIAVDKNRNIFIGGNAERRGSSSVEAVDVLTLKYNALITGINEQNITHVSMNIYPNPAKDCIHVDLNQTDFANGKMLILDAIGKIVREETLSNEGQAISVSALPQGVYFVKISGKQTVATGKFVIE